MGVDHVSLATGPAKFNEVYDFYLAVLKPLGYGIYFERKPVMLGLAATGGPPDFWLHAGGVDAATAPASADAPRSTTHVAFKADGRGQVDEWYKAAVAAGGVPNGEPGERPWAKGYYAAYVLDPLGNNVEVMHYKPE